MSCGVVRAAGHVGGDLPSTFCKGMRGKMGAATRITLFCIGTRGKMGAATRTVLFCIGTRGKMGAAMRITLHSAHGTLDRVGGTARTFRTRLKGAKRPMARTILHEAQGVCVCV